MIIKRVMIVALVIIGTWCAQAGYNGDCVTFSSEASFTLKTANASKNWDGTLWTSTDKTNWTEWNGALVSAEQTGGTYHLYVIGNESNTKITGYAYDPMGEHWYRWVLNGSNIACSGNIETLRGATGDKPSPTTMADGCYYQMFYGCTSLTSSPALPATILANRCYANMFSGCTSLTVAPSLPAWMLAYCCYGGMFMGCTALMSAPALPAEKLEEYCYDSMFRGCTSLTDAPTLPVMMLADYCYRNMFLGCTSLTDAPALPAMTLAKSCYEGIFSGCTSMMAAPTLPATTLAGSCYGCMFLGCTSLTAAPALPATTLAGGCYANMFSGCTTLTNAPALPATTLAGSCYSAMFRGCTALTNAPALPATTLEDYCYRDMFRDCTSLTSAPELPATVAKRECYCGMFSGCTSLTVAPALPATILLDSCYYEMFSFCTALTNAPALPATVLQNGCYAYMFCGCTALKVNIAAPGVEWKIPATSVWPFDLNWGTNMFKDTKGTLQGQPELNTTYYIKGGLPPGSDDNPWQIGAGEGDTVNAWTNGTGTLIVTGAGKMRAFAADGSGVPWPVADVSAVEISGDVTSIGQNAWCGLDDDVTYNGLSTTAAKTMYNGFGESLDYGRMVFKGFLVEDGVVKVTVALETAKSMTNEWAEIKLEAKDVSVDSNGRIIIIHDAGIQDQGFYLVQPTK